MKKISSVKKNSNGQGQDNVDNVGGASVETSSFVMPI